MHFLAILLCVNVRCANLQCSSRPHHPRPRRQFLPIRGRQQIQFVFHCEYRAVRRHQCIRRVSARTVRNRSRHSGMKIIVLLRQLCAKRHANRRMSGRQFHQLRAQVLHQPLALKTLPHPACKIRMFRVKPRLFFHSAAVYRRSIPASGWRQTPDRAMGPPSSRRLFLDPMNVQSAMVAENSGKFVYQSGTGPGIVVYSLDQPRERSRKCWVP